MKKASVLLALLLAALLLAGCGLSPASPKLQVTFFSAGKADAILLSTEHGAVLIDAGEKGFGKEILSFCRSRGVYALDCMILTHFDKDHAGGAPRVLRGLPVSRVLQTCPPEDGAAWESFAASLEELGVEPVTVREELEFSLDGVVFTVNPPRQERYAESSDNNSSLIVTVTCGSCRLLFPGDAENLRLDEWLADHAAPFDFVKLPHHGAWHRAVGTLLEQTRPAYALICCSSGEPEDPKTMKKLEKLGVRVFLTREGPVVLDCDGRSLTLRYAND